MTKSLTYTWPVFVLLLLYILGALIDFGILPFSFSYSVSRIVTLFFSIAGIYYLYTSPFGHTHFLALATLIIIRYLIPLLVPFNQITGISFYMGSNITILFYYCLRTLQKEVIRKIDYRKLFLVGGFILLQIVHYAGLLYIEYTPEENLSYSMGTYIMGISYMNIASILFAFAVVLLHLRHVGKWEKDQFDKNEMELIDKIGEDREEDQKKPIEP